MLGLKKLQFACFQELIYAQVDKKPVVESAPSTESDVFYFILIAHSGSFFEIKKNALISSTLKFPLFHALQTLRQN
jgi:hypothetical protein